MSNLRCHGAGFLTPGTDAGIMQTWMGSTSASCACRRAVDHTVRGCSPRGGGPTCSHGCCRERNDSFRWTKRASDYRSRQPGGACQWRPRPRSRACAGGRARETALLACERDAVAWILDRVVLVHGLHLTLPGPQCPRLGSSTASPSPLGQDVGCMSDLSSFSMLGW